MLEIDGTDGYKSQILIQWTVSKALFKETFAEFTEAIVYQKAV